MKGLILGLTGLNSKFANCNHVTYFIHSPHKTRMWFQNLPLSKISIPIKDCGKPYVGNLWIKHTVDITEIVL